MVQGFVSSLPHPIAGHDPLDSSHTSPPLPPLSSQSHGSSPGSGHRVFSLEITDETNAFFLHSLVLGEQEYAVLRSSQSLLVDFQGFAPHLLKLLESCLQSKRSSANHPR